MYIIIGASGFIGKHLIATLSKSTSFPLRAVTRNYSTLSTLDNRNVDFIQGDITDKSSVLAMLSPGATVVNLAFSNLMSTDITINSITDMIEACANIGIKRLIHCSSTSVYGRVNGEVNEYTKCAPNDAYGRNKLAIEEVLLDKVGGRFELVILRPSEVFGVGGKALFSLMQSLQNGGLFWNYMRSSINQRRRTHFVPVQAVVDAIQFLIEEKRKLDSEVFIVSADDDPLNNFHDIEKILIDALHLTMYRVKQVPIPRFVLEKILLVAGRSTIDSQIVFSPEKLQKYGFHNKYNIEQELKSLAESYKRLCSGIDS